VQTCSQCHTQSPDSVHECPTCHADLRQSSNTAVALRKFQDNPRVKSIRIQVAHDCCPACQQMMGVYSKDDVPQLPVEACSHPQGCRCFYTPILEEIYP